jgi:hypothetical protein
MGLAIDGTTHRRAAGMLAIPLLLGMAIVLVVPAWVVPYPPLPDYPNHLASVFVLGQLTDPHWRFSEFYRADWTFSSNVLTDAALAAPERIVPPELGGRILLSVCPLALPAATWFFLHHANAGYEAQALSVPAVACNGRSCSTFRARDHSALRRASTFHTDSKTCMPAMRRRIGIASGLRTAPCGHAPRRSVHGRCATAGG